MARGGSTGGLFDHDSGSEWVYYIRILESKVRSDDIVILSPIHVCPPNMRYQGKRRWEDKNYRSARFRVVAVNESL
jgi:hypothetical protein